MAGWFGWPTRRQLVRVKVEKIIVEKRTTTRGFRLVYKLVDNEGHVAALISNRALHRVKRGDMVVLKATVAKHTHSASGIETTLLQRAKVVEVTREIF